MISAEALVALGQLEGGARYNTLHSVARELMAAGLAGDDWGHLSLTEQGRIYLRRGRFNIAITSDEQACDLSKLSIDRTPSARWKGHALDDGERASGDPMAAPHLINKPLELIAEAPPEPLPIAQSRKQEMMRAAGVASGVTGVWVEEAWVEAFIRALDMVTPTENSAT